MKLECAPLNSAWGKVHFPFRIYFPFPWPRTIWFSLGSPSQENSCPKNAQVTVTQETDSRLFPQSNSQTDLLAPKSWRKVSSLLHSLLNSLQEYQQLYFFPFDHVWMKGQFLGWIILVAQVLKWSEKWFQPRLRGGLYCQGQSKVTKGKSMFFTFFAVSNFI